MSRFAKLSHMIWYCKYHIVWSPKYRYRILVGDTKEEVAYCIRMFAILPRGKIEGLSVQRDDVHLIIRIPPKVSVSEMMGVLKGRTAIRVFSQYKKLKEWLYWDNHFWAKGYCEDTIGLDAEKIRVYVKYQEEQEKKNREKIKYNPGTTKEGLCLLRGQRQIMLSQFPILWVGIFNINFWLLTQYL